METKIEKQFAEYVRKHGENDGIMHLWYLPGKIGNGTSFKYGEEERVWDALSLRAFKEDCEDADYWKDKIEVFFIDSTDTHEINMSLTEVADIAPELHHRLMKYMAQTMVENEMVVNGFDLMALNWEFGSLLKKHNDDTDCTGESREDFLNLMLAVDNDKDLLSYHAAICNAWDELCSLHQGLRESGLSWWAGAQWTDYPNNPWDIYIGIGNELD